MTAMARAAARRQQAAIERELDQLATARRQMCSRMHYATVAGILEKSGLPYRLVQEDRDDLGAALKHGYRYRFTSDWSGPATLYIQETKAGRQAQRSMGTALDVLEMVLRDRLRGFKREAGAPGF